MKVTENSTYRLMNTNLNRITNNLQDLRNQGATGLKLNEPSDDPSSIRPVLTTRTQIRHTERYLETMGVTLDKMQATDGHLEHVENIMQRAKEIALNAVNGAMSESDLQTLADEVVQLREELLDSANAMIDGKYIFSGFAENTKPFVENPAYDPALYDPADSTTWRYLYQGDANPTELEITPGELLEVNLTGNNLFLGVSDANWVDAATPAAGQPEPGRVDLFSVLTRLEEAIRANNIDDPLGEGGGIQNNIENLEIAADQERRLRSRLGNRATRVESAIAHQETVLVDLEQILSRYQDADAIATFNEIVKQETAFQAALNVTSRVSKISILDYF
ncbi:flagellar hook-associated protein FlgL [Desulfofustis glycolicus]|uniref:Flagellar hook-associated protein 3 FlgL n=1 Tax=Desulfofustis glycolicus DSM 9705 TaxID=1121409 RepID=A0A1M5U0G6_9BACT|nr:flagellar hook-associated protein FlgL [Desulfofustis glycolicus]SHH56371.1 flagellar hook-associated protein 3 FlgL [Desulfofustis glycolicus DSM 9705]